MELILVIIAAVVLLVSTMYIWYSHRKNKENLRSHSDGGQIVQKTMNKNLLQEFYYDIVMDIVYNYFEIKILKEEEFHMFLERNQHTVFHAYMSKIPCCQCANSSLPPGKKVKLHEKQFLLLYEQNRQPEPGHELKQNNGVKQYCLCVYSPNKSTSLLSLDIILLFSLMKSCCVSYHGHPSWFKDVKSVRNEINHLGDKNTLSKEKKKKLWIKLEESALNIASTIGKSYQERQKQRINRIRKSNSAFEAIIEAVVTGEENLVSEFRQLEIKIDNLCFQVKQILVMTDNTTRFNVVDRMNSDEQGNGKCYIAWKFKNPGNWNKQDMIKKLKGISMIADYKIEFVYEGSIVVITSTIQKDILDIGFEVKPEDFIRQFAEITDLETTTRNRIEVEMFFSSSTSKDEQKDRVQKRLKDEQKDRVQKRLKDEQKDRVQKRLKGDLCDLTDNNKRWLLVGIGLHTVIIPALRKYVAPRLDQLWQNLKTTNKIDVQVYPHQMKSYLSTFFNYEAINNNRSLGVKQQAKFDYRVKDSTDLSKLFLQTNMALHSVIDENCDLSALLCIIIKAGICPGSAIDFAERVHSEIWNPWTHCDFTQWDKAKYKESLDLMEELVWNLGLSIEKENDTIAELERWHCNGKKFIDGTTSVVLAEIITEVKALIKDAEVIVVDTPEKIQKLKDELNGAEQKLLNLSFTLQQAELPEILQNKRSIAKIKEEMDKGEDSVPNHMKEKYQGYIERWQEDESTFTVTRATKEVTRLIQENGVVLVTGSSGSGKSSIIHHVALELQSKEKYDVIPFVSSPGDILQYRDLKKNQVFVIDDLCGKNFINERDLQTWKEQADKIEQLFLSENRNQKDAQSVKKGETYGQMKILISCRLHILNDNKFKSLEIFNKQSVDLQSKDYSLLPKERHNMISKFTTLSDYNLKKLDKVMDKCSFFPLLCKMSEDKQVNQLTELFTSPVESIKKDIKDMIEYKHFEFCALVLCVLFPNELDETYINPRTAPQDVKVKVTEIVANFRIDLKIELERKQLVDTFNRLDGTYIKKIGSVYSIAHDKLYDMVAVTCGQKLVKLFIEYSPSSFIAERFRLLSGQNLEQDDSFLYLSDDIENVYFDRIFRDLKEQDGTSFFHNQQLKEERYKDKVMGYIKEHTDSCKQVFLELDDKGLLDKNDDDYTSTHRPIRSYFYTSTPMIEASKIGFYELVKYLISIKCNVNKTGNYGFSPLWYCCYYGHVNIVELLITNGGNIQDALCYACECGNINIVRMCLERNVDVSQSGGRFGWTPLLTACWMGHTDIVRLLLQSNADPRQRGGWEGGLTPLDAADNETIEKLLMSYIKD